MRTDIGFLVTALALGMVVSPVGAANFNVNATVDDIDLTPGDGSCVSATIGMCTLRAAIQEANALTGDDVIQLPAGVYTLTLIGAGENAGATGDLDVQDTVSIYGQGIDVTIVDAAGLDRVFELHGGVLELVGLTVMGGRAITSGTEIGGGIRAAGDMLVIGGCRLTDNVGNLGGAIFASSVTPVQIADSIIDGNTTQTGTYNPLGPAIYAEGGLLLESSTATDNAGPNANFFAVEAQCYNGSITVVNSTVAANQASGLTTYNCDTTVLHATIYGNAGVGLALGSFDGSATLSVANSVIAGQGGNDCVGTSGTVAFEHSLDSDGTCGLSGAAGSLPMTDPDLLPLRNWGGYTPTMYPRPVTSPVIDAADGTVCYITDQRGEVRGGDGNGDGTPGCDMGAVEAGDLIFFDDFEDGTTDAW